MQQIRKRGKRKKKSPENKFWNLSIWNKLDQTLVRETDYRWNQIYPSLMLMYEKLDKLGFAYCDGDIMIVDSS